MKILWAARRNCKRRAHMGALALMWLPSTELVAVRQAAARRAGQVSTRHQGGQAEWRKEVQANPW